MQFCAVYQAEAEVLLHLRLTFAPSGQRIGPLACVVQGVPIDAVRDRVAVQDPGDHGRQLALGGDHEHLIDQAQPVGNPAHVDQGPALIPSGEPEQVGVVEAAGDLHGLACRRVARLVVPGPHLLQPGGDQQPAPLGAVVTRFVEQALRTGEPTAGGYRLTSEQQAVADPERDPDRGQEVTRLEVRPVCPFEGGHVRIRLAHHVRGPPQRLEVARGQSGRAIGLRQREKRLAPGRPRQGFPSAIEHCDGVRHSSSVAPEDPLGPTTSTTRRLVGQQPRRSPSAAT